MSHAPASRYPFSGTSWCASLHPNVTRAADTVTTRPDGSILFYHRAAPDYVGMWDADLVNQEMENTSIPNPLAGSTFGGVLSSGGANGSFLVSSGPTSLTTEHASTSHALSIAGNAGRFAHHAPPRALPCPAHLSLPRDRATPLRPRTHVRAYRAHPGRSLPFFPVRPSSRKFIVPTFNIKVFCTLMVMFGFLCSCRVVS